MSCASSNLANQDTNYYQNVNGYAVPSSIPYNPNTNKNGCIKSGYPPFGPTIGSLSVNISVPGTYSLVYIYGTNFLPPSYGTTYVNFGPFKNLPITFYSTNSISFVVPLNAQTGIYKVVVVNIYNSNFSPSVNQSYSGNPNFSNPVSYQLLYYTVNNGTYNVTSNLQYNTIITFTANSSITFYQNYAINYTIVGGGGGGGGGSGIGGGGGGGGGGGQVSNGIMNLSSNITYNIGIGAGGNGGIGSNSSPTNGFPGNSCYFVGNNFSLNVNGGLPGLASNGSTGGNGGNSGNGGVGGASGANGTNVGGGGGGSFSLNGGNGSINLSNSLYGGGGGGGIGTFGQHIGTGSGGGGDGGYIDGNPGTVNTGGGGGGGGVASAPGNGGNGASGTVILYFNV